MFLIGILCLIIAAPNTAQSCCQPGEPTDKLKKAIMRTNFSSVKEIMDHPETVPLIEVSQYKQLAAATSQVRLEGVKLQYTDPLRFLNSQQLSYTMAAYLFAGGILNILNIKNHVEKGDYLTVGAGSIVSLAALYQGGRIFLDSVWARAEKKLYADALAIEKLLEQLEQGATL